MRVALLEMLHPDLRRGRPADPAGGRDRRGGRDRQGVLRRPGAGLRQRHPRRGAARRAREWRRAWLTQRLDELVDAPRARRRRSCAPATCRPTRAAALVDECARARRRGRAPSSTAACARPSAGAAAARPAGAGLVSTRARHRARAPPTRTTCARRSSATWRSCASPREPAAAGLEEAMRYSLLAGGKRIRPVLALATARALGREPRERAPARRRARADPHLLADPRRPAGHGRRRAAPRPPDVPRALRRGRRDPRRRRPLRRGVPAACCTSRRATRRAVLAAVGELADATGVNGMVGGQYIDVRGSPSGARRACGGCTSSRPAA